MLVLFGLLKGACQLLEGSGNGIAGSFLISGLLVLLGQGNAANQPPNGSNNKGDDQCSHLTDAEYLMAQYHHQAQHKGNHRADVAQGVAQGGDPVHSVVVGNFREHGIVKYIGRGVAHLGNHKDDQEGQPAPGNTQSGAADGTQQHTEQKQGLLKASLVCQRTANRSDNGNQNGGDGASIAPVGQIVGLADVCALGKGIEVNGEQSGNQQNEGRVCHIVENPALFQLGKL